MRVIGLTGSIACGKSTVSAELLRMGYPVIDGDLLSRELTRPGGIALPRIRQAFGDSFFQEDGRLNRRALGRLVFQDPEARRRLDDLLAPFLIGLTENKIREAEQSDAHLCFLDMPLLFEKGYDRYCDSVWCVWLPEDIQLQRLMDRDGYSREEALARMRAVMSSDEKAALSEHVLDNSHSVEQLLATVHRLAETEEQCSVTPHEPLPPSVSGNKVFPPAHEEEAAIRAVERSVPMARPPKALNAKQRQRAFWAMPSWLIRVLALLTLGFFVLLASDGLMLAYLKKQADLHADEQAAIDAHYPIVFRPLIEQYAAEYNLRPSFVAAVILNESSFDPLAESHAGARGLMQLMPDTAEWIAGKLHIEGYAFERMNDPESNIRFGCWYLNYLSRMFRGDPVCVISAYHAGQGQVSAWLSNPAYSPDGIVMPWETMPDGPTKKYAGKVTRDDAIYQEKYFDQPSAVSDAAPDSAVRN